MSVADGPRRGACFRRRPLRGVVSAPYAGSAGGSYGVGQENAWNRRTGGSCGGMSAAGGVWLVASVRARGRRLSCVMLDLSSSKNVPGTFTCTMSAIYSRNNRGNIHRADGARGIAASQHMRQ